MDRITVTDHVVKRAAQRNLSPRDIAYVLKHGRVLYRTGIKFYFLGWRDIPEQQRHLPHIGRLEGVTVLMGQNRTLVTVYKDPDAIRKIKRKSKRLLLREAA